MTNTGYARTSAFPQPYRQNLPDRHAAGTDWTPLEVFTVTPPSSEPWHCAVYCTADVDAATIGQLRFRSSASAVVSPAVNVTGFTRNLRLGFQGIANGTQLIYVEGRRLDGPGGVRLLDARPSILSAPPAGLITGAPPAGGGGGGSGGGGDLVSDVRSTFVSDDQATTFTIMPDWFSPPAEPGDKVALMGFAPGPSENASHTWTFPGSPKIEVAGGAFHPRAKVTEADYSAAGWTVSASNNFRAAAICFKDTLSIVASTPVQNTIPADPTGVAHGANSSAVVVNVVNFTTAEISGPTTTPGTHATIIDKKGVPRQVHAAKIARPTAGTYDPGVATVAGTGSEQSTVFALVGQPTVASGSIPAPTVPAFSATVTLSTLGADIAAAVAAQAPGTHFQLIAGTYTNWNDVRPKTNMHFKGPASGVAVLSGTGKTWAFRAIDATGSSDNVTISGPVGSIKIQDYGAGTTRAEYGAIQAQPTSTGVGSTEFTYGCAQNWFIQGVELSKNGAQGIRISDYCTLYQVTAYGHNVSGVGGDRNVGGLWHSCTINANGLNPATGAYSNGAGAKITGHNGSEFRTQVLPAGVTRAKAPLIIANTNMTATHAGVTGTGNIGLWLDLDCQQVQIYDSNFDDHPWCGVMVEGGNNVYMRGIAIDNSDGYSTGAGGAGEDFLLGALTIAESTNVTVEDYGILNSVRAVIVRQSNRSADWFNANNSSFVNYAWAAGPRYWITATGPLPIPGLTDRANMWTGNITLRNGLFTSCDRVLIQEGSNGGGMACSGSIPLASVVFEDNDYTSSTNITNATSGGGFFDRSNTGLTLTQWRALPYTRDQP